MRAKSHFWTTVSSIALMGAAYGDARAQPPMAAPPSWSGPYVGVNLGAAWHNWSFDDRDNLLLLAPFPFGSNLPNEFWSGSQAAATVGGQFGYNWQSGNIVYGLEADLNWVGAKDNLTIVRPAIATATATTQLDWLATLRGRLGIALSPTLIYVTAGLALGHVTDTYGFIGSPYVMNSGIKAGWVGGAGVEHMLSSHWTVKVEGLYADLGADTVQSFIFGSNYRSRFEHAVFLLRGGLNWKW